MRDMRGVCPKHLGVEGRSLWLVWVTRIKRWGHDWVVGGLDLLVKRPHNSVPSQAPFGRAVERPLIQQSRSVTWSGHKWQGLQVTADGVGVGNTPPCASGILPVLLRAVGLALLFL